MAALIKTGTRVRVKRHAGWGAATAMHDIRRGAGGTVMTEAGAAAVTWEDLAVLRDQTPPQLPPMRFRLPYGAWTFADGREVLFNRDYEPIWERRDSGPAMQPSAQSREGERAGRVMFYRESAAPWDNPASLRRCEGVLEAWGVASVVGVAKGWLGR